MAATERIYGFTIPPSEYGPRGCLAAPETSATGNTVLRAGREHYPHGNGWEQVAHIVLTPDERESLIAALVALRDEPPDSPPPMTLCGCGATSVGECCAAVEGYYTSLSQRSDEELRTLAKGDDCTAAQHLVALRALQARRTDSDA